MPTASSKVLGPTGPTSGVASQAPQPLFTAPSTQPLAGSCLNHGHCTPMHNRDVGTACSGIPNQHCSALAHPPTPHRASPCLCLPTPSLLPNRHQAGGSVLPDLPLTPGCEIGLSLHLHPTLPMAARTIRAPSTQRLVPRCVALGKTGLQSCPGSLKVNNDDEMIMLEAAGLAHLIVYKIGC